MLYNIYILIIFVNKILHEKNFVKKNKEFSKININVAKQPERLQRLSA